MTVSAAGIGTTGSGAAGIGVGTYNFQCWFRDPNGPLMSGFNLSDAIV